MTKLAQCTACKNFTHEGACKYYKYLDDSSCEQYELPLNNSKGMFTRIFSFKGRIRKGQNMFDLFVVYVICLFC